MFGRSILIFLVIALPPGLVGCNSHPPPTTSSTSTSTPAPTAIAETLVSGTNICDHPYFPLRPGAYWKYHFVVNDCVNCENDIHVGAETDARWQVTNVQSNTEGSRGTMLMKTSDEHSRSIDFLCDSTGIRFLYYSCSEYCYHQDSPCSCYGCYNQFHTSQEDATFLDKIGTCPSWSPLPTANLLRPGYSWSGPRYHMWGSSGGYDYTTEYEIATVEMVDVGNQEYFGRRIVEQIQCDQLAGVRWSDPSVDQHATATIMLAKGIGVVRMSIDINRTARAGGSPTVSTSIAVEAELMEFGIEP